jgi:hypothetical protein
VFLKKDALSKVKTPVNNNSGHLFRSMSVKPPETKKDENIYFKLVETVFMLSKIDARYINNILRLLEIHKSTISSEKMDELLDIIENKNEIEIMKKFLNVASISSKRLSLLIVKYTWNYLKDSLEKLLEPSFSNILHNCDLIKVLISIFNAYNFL